MADELSFKIAPIVDDSAGAKKNFQDSINTLVKNMKGANAPKIELTVKKINGKSAIQTFKSEIEQAIGTFGTSIGKNSITNQSKQWKSIFKDSVKDITAPNIDLKPLNSYYKNLEKQANAGTKALQKLNNVQKSGVITKQFTNFDSNIQKFEQLGYTVTEVKTKLNEAVLARQKFESSKTGSVAEQDKAYKSLVVSMNAVKNAMSAISTQNSNDTTFNKNKVSLHQLILEMQRFEKANDKLRTNSTFSGTYNKLLSDAKKAYGTNNIANVQKLREQFRALQNDMLKAGLEGQRFGTRLTNQFAKFGVYLSAATVFMAIRRVIRSMITDVVELDKAMTELKKVTDETDSTYSRFLDNAESRAKRLGATLTDIVSASADFARLGFSLSEAENLADAAIIYKNIGDGITDINEASQSIISTMKAFSIESSKAIDIVDRLNEVGNNFAISSQGIGESLKRSASALSASGNTLEESIGMITAMNEILQDPEKVGTSLRTISMRLRNTAGALQDMGEDADGAAESVTQLQQKIKALSGVDIMKDADTFKSTYTIMTELSQVWGNLTDKSQADITRLVAGIRQGNAMSALMKNMSTGIKATETAMNSLGSATKENDKYLESINGRLQIFKASFEALSNTVINSNLLKTIIDLGTAFVNFANTGIVQTVMQIGLMVGAVKLLSVAFKAFTATNFATIISGLFASATLGAAEFMATLGLLEFAIVSNPLFLPIVAGTAILVLPKIFDALTVSLDDLNKKITETSSEIDSLQSEFSSLLNKGDLTDNEKNRLGLLNAQIKAKKELLDLDKKQAFDLEFNNNDQGYKSRAGVEVNQSGTEKLSGLISDYQKLVDEKSDNLEQDDKAIAKRAELINSITDYSTKLQDAKDSGIELTDQQESLLSFTTDIISEYNNLSNASENVDEELSNTSESVKTLADSISSLSTVSDGLKTLNKAFEDFSGNGEVAFSTIADISDKFKDVAGTDTYISKLYDADLTAKELNNTLTDLTYAYINNKMSVDQLANANEDEIASMLKEIGVKNASAVASEMITNAKIQQKIATFDLANATETEKDVFFKEIEAMGLTESAVNSLRNAFNSAQIGMSSSALEGAQSRLQILQSELANIIAIATAYQSIGGMSGQITGAVGIGLGTGLSMFTLAKNLASLKSIKLGGVPKVSYGGNSKKSGGSGSNSDKKDPWLEEFKKAKENLDYQLNMDLITQQQYYDDLTALDKKYFEGKESLTDEYFNQHRSNLEELYKLQKELFDDEINDIEHQISILSKHNDTEKERISLYRELQDKVHKLADDYRARGLDENDDLIQNLQTQWWSYADEIKSIMSSISDSQTDSINNIIDLTMELIKQEVENQVDVLEKQKELYSDIVDKKKEALQLAKEENNYQKSVSDKLNEILKIQAKIDELKPDTSRQSVAEQKQLSEELLKLQSELQDTQADYAYDTQIDSLDKQQQAFEDSKDDEIKQVKETINTTQKLYELAINRIDSDWNQLKLDLIQYNNDYKDGIRGQDSIVSAWEEAKKAAQEYGGVVEALNGTQATSKGDYSALVSAKVSQMKQNSAAWHTADQSGQASLALQNEQLARQISSIIGSTLTKDSNGIWRLSNGDKLFDKYHTGGIAGNNPTLKQNEMMAILEKGEPILNKQKEDSVYKLIDFTSTIFDKFNGVLSAFNPSSMSNLQNLINPLNRIILPTQNTSNFSPNIVVNVNGVSDVATANKVGNMVGNTLLDKLSQAGLKGLNPSLTNT